MFVRLAVAALAALSLSAHAASTTIDFDDVAFFGAPVALPGADYQGFDFDGVAGPGSWIISPSWFGLFPGDDAHSGANYAWGNGGFQMQMTRDGGGRFDFTSLWARGADGTTLTVVATGYRNGAKLYSQTFTEGMTYSQETLGFVGIDKLTLDMDGTLLLDDLVVDQTSIVPEPFVPALLLAGLGVLGLAARRRRA